MSRFSFPLISFWLLLSGTLLLYPSIISAQQDTTQVATPDSTLSILDLVDMVEGGDRVDLSINQISDILDSLRGPQKVITAIPPANEINRVLRTVPQSALPEGLSLTLTDSVQVGAQHIEALKRFYSRQVLPVDKKRSAFEVFLVDTTMFTMAHVEAWPLKLAERDLRYRYLFQSEEERKVYADTLERRFKKEVCVRLKLRSLFPTLMNFNESGIKSMSLVYEKREQEIQVRWIGISPITNRMWGFVSWSERDMKVCFPRYNGMRDIWKSGDLELKIVLNLSEISYYANEYFIPLN